MRMENGNYEEVEIPKVELGYWAGTIRRWFREGLPMKNPIPDNYLDGMAIMSNKSIYSEEEIEKFSEYCTLSIKEKLTDRNVQPVFNLDQYLTKFPVDYSPMLPKKTIKEGDDYKIFVDQYGVIQKMRANYTYPLDIDYPIKDWETWNEYKQGYSEDTIEKRLPPDWDNLVKRLKNRDFPIRLGGWYGGFFGIFRRLTGEKMYLYQLYDNPKLIHDICKTFLKFLKLYYGRIIQDIEVDCVLISEDIAGKQGSYMSPAHYKEFIAPYHKGLVDFVKDFGIDIVILDSDGYMRNLLPLILETGITGWYPVERAAGNDLLKFREVFPNLQIMGGFDKRVLFESSNKEKIDAELDIIHKMFKKGRFISHMDHFVSKDCTWKNFSYYRKKLNDITDEFNNLK